MCSDPRADLADLLSSRLAAESLADATHDPASGLPRAATLLRSAAPSPWDGSGHPAVIGVHLHEVDAARREHGHAVARAMHQRAAGALGVAFGSRVGVVDVGRFLLLTDPASSEAQAETARHTLSQVTAEAVTVGTAVGPPECATVCAALLPAEQAVGSWADRVVSTQSGRVRGLHLRRRAGRDPQALDAGAAAALATEAVAVLADLAPERLSRITTVWLDVCDRAVGDAELEVLARHEWPRRPGFPRLGLRVHPVGWLAPDTLLDRLARLRAAGVEVGLAGLSTGLVDPPRLDPGVVRDVVLDASLVGGAMRDAGDRSLARGLTAVARGLPVTITADGVDDVGRFVLARSLGAWYGEGALFGPTVALAELGDGPDPDADLRPETPLAMLPWPDRMDRELTDDLCALLRRWAYEGMTPATMRHRLNALRVAGRWTLESVSAAVGTTVHVRPGSRVDAPVPAPQPLR